MSIRVRCLHHDFKIVDAAVAKNLSVHIFGLSSDLHQWNKRLVAK